MFAPEQFLQHCFSFDQWQSPQVFTVELEQVKRNEDALTTAEKQIAKDGASGFIDAGNLAIENSAFNLEVFSDPFAEICKTAKYVSIPRNQFSLAGLDVSKCAESIDLQFKDKLVGVEGLSATGELYRA